MNRISRRTALTGAAGGAFIAAAAPAGAAARRPATAAGPKPSQLPTPVGARGSGARKLINAGWDRPGPQYLAANAARMQEAPFDGLVFNLWETKPNHHVGNTWTLFQPRDVPGYPYSDVDAEDFARIKWTGFTDNLIAAHPCPHNTPGIDFFSERVWSQARLQVRLLGQVLRASSARGIWLDPEGGKHGMQYTPEHYPGRTFDEVAAQARLRGGQFMRALQHEKSDVKVLFTVLGTSARYPYENSSDPDTSTYGLVAHFAAGMLDTKNGQASIIDGSENDYYHFDSQQFVSWRQYLDGAWYAYPPDAQEAYAASVQMGAAVYADGTMTIKKPGSWVAKHFSFYEDILDDVAFKAKWLKHNVYNAMLKSDEYVWLWNEKMSWWNPDEVPLPEGADEAVREARDLFNAGAPLGYDMCRAGDVGTPAFVDSPSIDLRVCEDGTTGLRAGDTLVVRGAPVPSAGAPDVAQVVFYHNDRVLEQARREDWRTAVKLAPGAHTFHAVGFNADGTHCSSNPLVVNVA